MVEKQNKYSGLLYFIDTSHRIHPNGDEIKKNIEIIVNECRKILSPHLLKIIDEFNKLQEEGFSLTLRCYALRRFIEGFTLWVEEHFSTKEITIKRKGKEERSIGGISVFLNPDNNFIKKLQNQLMYKNIINELDNEIHDNPIPLIIGKGFNTILGMLNGLIYLDLGCPYHTTYKDKLIKEYDKFLPSFESFLNKNKALNNNTIKKINEKISLFDFRCAIVDIINDSYDGVNPIPNKETLRDILLINLLINREIPESEISSEQLKEAISILDDYIIKRKSIAMALEINYDKNKLIRFIAISRKYYLPTLNTLK